MGFLTSLASGIWGYVAAAVVSASIAAFGAYEVTAAFKDRTINQLELADAQFAQKAEQQAAADQKARDQITLDAAVKDAKAQPEIVTHYETITKEIPAHVSDTAHCITFGLVRVLNSAAGPAAFAVPDAAGEPDDACAPISWREFAGDLTADYQAKTQNDQQLTDLQGWVADQASASGPK